MNRGEFVALLTREGFGEIVMVERDAHGFLDTHAHPFEAKALILDGEIRLRAEDADRVFTAGQIFHLAAGELHSERYGPDGVRYLVGRK